MEKVYAATALSWVICFLFIVFCSLHTKYSLKVILAASAAWSTFFSIICFIVLTVIVQLGG